jgi:lysozyme family protein
MGRCNRRRLPRGEGPEVVVTAFNRAFRIVVGEEGGYVNDPRDPGGETKYGISKRAYPDEDIRNLTLDRARELYRRDYWDRVRGDELPYRWALLVFDAAVNQGVEPAVRMMQDALGVMVDGRIGPRTLAAAQSDDDRRPARFLALRVFRYQRTANFDRFGYGWITRCFVIALEAHQ